MFPVRPGYHPYPNYTMQVPCGFGQNMFLVNPGYYPYPNYTMQVPYASGENMFPVTPGCYACPNYAVQAPCGSMFPVTPGCNPCPVPQVLPQACNIWYEECLPTFQDVCLQSFQLPTDHKIYIMYHGTSYVAANQIIKHGFIPSKVGMLGEGVYVTRDIHKAMKYPLHDPRKVVLKLRVNVGKVIKIDCQNHPLQKTWHDHGYNTAWVPPHCGMTEIGREEDCVYDPTRIKVIDVTHGEENDVTELKHLLNNIIQNV